MRLSRIRDEYPVKADVYIEPSDRWMTSIPVVESKRSGGGTLTGRRVLCGPNPFGRKASTFSRDTAVLAPVGGTRRYSDTMTDFSALPVCEFAFPGTLRDRLVDAVLDGSKTSTTATLIEYESEQEDLPVAGLQEVVIDSDGRPVAVIELTEVRRARLAEVDLQHAIDEGEGFTTVAQWRSGHEEFWHSQEMRDALGDPHFSVDDDTVLVLQRFKVVARLSE